MYNILYYSYIRVLPQIPLPSLAGNLNDLYALVPDASEWARVSAARGSAPPPRYSPGFAAAGRALFVFGGSGSAGRPSRLAASGGGGQAPRFRDCHPSRSDS